MVVIYTTREPKPFYYKKFVCLVHIQDVGQHGSAGIGVSRRARRRRRQRLCRALHRASRLGNQVGLLANVSIPGPVDRPVASVTPIRRIDAGAGHIVAAVPVVVPSTSYFMPGAMTVNLQESVRIVNPPQERSYLYLDREFLYHLTNYPLDTLPPIALDRINILPDGPLADVFPPIPSQTVFGTMLGPGGSNVIFYDQDTDSD